MDEYDAPGLADLRALSSLDDPTRRRLYELAAAAERPVSREEAAAALGISRALAAYHLEKLTAHGLLEVEPGRPPGPPGPGAGRPPKLYRRAGRDFVLRAPSRDYRILAELLVRAASQDEHACRTIEQAAGTLGEQLAVGADGTIALLRARGYEPRAEGTEAILLRNCPFAQLASRCPDVVCAINLALVRGLLRGSGGDPGRARLVPHADRCCVVIDGP